MVVTCVHVVVKEEFIENFILASVENHRQSTREPGNTRFDVLQSSEDPTKFLLYEAYESYETAANHKKTDHYLKWRETVSDWMAEPRKGISYKSIKP